MEFVRVKLSIIEVEQPFDYVRHYELIKSRSHEFYIVTSEDYAISETLKQLKDNQKMCLEYVEYKMPEFIKSQEKYNIFKDPKSPMTTPGLLPFITARYLQLKDVNKLLLENGVKVDTGKEYYLEGFAGGIHTNENVLHRWNYEIEEKRKELRKWVKPGITGEGGDLEEEEV